MKTIRVQLSFSELRLQFDRIGDDLCITVHGGDLPHIGCAVLAVPRPSLTGNGSMSCTSSVLNLTGHKDETICRLLAERVCVHYQKTCLCTGGFHVDNMSPAQIQEVVEAVKGLNPKDFY